MTVVFCIAVVLDGEHRNLVFAVTGHDSGSLLVGRRIDTEPELEQESLELRGVHLKKINVSKKARRLLLCLHFWSQAIYETYHMKTCDSLGLAGGLTERHSMTTCVLIGDPLHQLPLLVLVRDKNRRVHTGAGRAHEFSTCNVISVRMHEVQRQLSGTSNGLAKQLLQSKVHLFTEKKVVRTTSLSLLTTRTTSTAVCAIDGRNSKVIAEQPYTRRFHSGRELRILVKWVWLIN